MSLSISTRSSSQNISERVGIFIILLLGSLLSALYFRTLMLHFDNLQILDKVVKLLDQGQWTHYGNVGSGVGYVPGSFLTAITALPFTLYFSPYSAMAVIWIFHFGAWALLALTLRELKRSDVIFPMTILFWLNPWRVELSELYNPAYLPLFSALHLWSALRLTRPRFFESFLHVLSIGLAAQLHYSFVILAFCSLLLLTFRLCRPHWGGVIAGLALILLSLVPYFTSYINDPALHVDVARDSKAFVGRNLILVYPLLKAIGYWLRYASEYCGRHIFTEIRFDWIGHYGLSLLVSQIFHFLKWPLAALTLYFSFLMNRSVWLNVKTAKAWSKNVDRSGLGAEARFHHYFFYLFLGMLIASALSPVEFNHWHLILCFPAISLMLSVYLVEFLKARPRWPKPLILTLISLVFFVHGFLGGMASRSHSWRNDYHRAVLEHYGRLPTANP